jgi:hypothetical protein
MLASETPFLMERRICSKPGCQRSPKPDARYCKPCFATANRASHRRHRKQRNLRRRDRADNRDQATRARDSARAKLAVAIKRGTIAKHPCARCGSDEDLTGFIADPERWREVVWLCRNHHLIERERTAQTDATKAKKDEWETLRQQFTEAWPHLTIEEQDALWKMACEDPIVARCPFPLHPEAPLMHQALIRAYGAQQKEEGPLSRPS